MKVKHLPTLLGIALLATTAQAAESTYRGELSASYGQSNEDESLFDSSFYGLKGTYYFSGVNTRNHPLAEAAFLEKSSNIYVQGSRIDLDNFDYTVDLVALGVDYYIPDSMLFVGAAIAQAHVDDGFGSDNDSVWTAKLGITPISGLQVWSEFMEDVDVSDSWNLNAKYVTPLSGETALNLEARYEDDEDDSTTSLVADYYLSRNFSLGAGVGFGEDDDSYLVRSRYFFTDKFSLEVNYATGDDSNTWQLGANVRF